MGKHVRVAIAGAVAGCVFATGSAFAVGSGNIQLPDYTKGTPGLGGTLVTLRWTPPLYTVPALADRQELWLFALPGGSSSREILPPTAVTSNPLLSNGARYLVSVRGCETAAAVCSSNPFEFVDASDETRIDATGPTGTVQINGGAEFTNNPAATLTLAATDPPIIGPETASGISQYAVDVDGDGTYPCPPLFTEGDASGCARTFEPTGSVALPAGDGLKTVGVTFGDAAREVRAPCTTPFCFILIDRTLLGNKSTAVADTITLDTVKPVAALTQDRSSVERTGVVRVDASTSTDAGATASGVDPTLTRWDFKDGSAPATGAVVSHAYAQAGTFVGEVTVTDRAGNSSDPRQFVVTVTPRPGDATSGSGSVAGVSGSAAFALNRLQVAASYKASVLKGSLSLGGTASQAGPVQITLTPKAGRARTLTTTLSAGAFQNTVKLPANLVPGTYGLRLVGPGGTLTSTLTLTAPKEGVVATKGLSATRTRAVATFRFAALPATSLRGRLAVRWTQGKRVVATLPIGSGNRLRSTLRGSGIRVGLLTAELRAGTTPIARVSTKVR